MNISSPQIYAPEEHSKIGSPVNADEQGPPIDAWSIMLASIDKKAYSREVLRDANELLKEIVLPMSFPWNHNVEPFVKAFPRDIDEMYDVQTAGNELLQDGAFGKFETILHAGPGRMPPHDTRVAARRSEDPGVVELTSIHAPSAAQFAAMPYCHSAVSDRTDEVDLPGDISLRVYQEVQARESLQLQQASVNLTTSLVSFRVGGTSSRSTLIQATADSRSPLLLEALLPPSVQEGSKKKSRKGGYADALGSYGSLVVASNGSGRVRSGRIRLVWSAKETGSQRGYSSILTGRPFENGAHKRPRSVNVLVRVNGSLLSSDVAQPDDAYDDEVVEEAIECACGPAPLAVNYEQCVLDSVAFQRNIKKIRLLQKRDLSFAFKSPKPFSAPVTRTGETDLQLVVNPPQLDCVVAEDGMVYVCYPSRGSFSIVAKSSAKKAAATAGAPAEVSEEESDHSESLCVLLDKTAADRNLCSVCWSGVGPEKTITLLKCDGCHLTVHSTCYGSFDPSKVVDNWKCDSCLDFDKSLSGAKAHPLDYQQHRGQNWCGMCMTKGGCLSRQEDSEWVHDVCRIWCPNEIHPPPFCALCNNSKRPVMRCAADNCQVFFHPLCALITSNAADVHHESTQLDHDESESERLIRRDKFLCTQFKLAKLEVATTATGETATLPVAFCGYHNPERRADFYGLYPGGRCLRDAMRIPPLNSDLS